MLFRNLGTNGLARQLNFGWLIDNAHPLTPHPPPPNRRPEVVVVAEASLKSTDVEAAPQAQEAVVEVEVDSPNNEEEEQEEGQEEEEEGEGQEEEGEEDLPDLEAFLLPLEAPTTPEAAVEVSPPLGGAVYHFFLNRQTLEVKKYEFGINGLTHSILTAEQFLFLFFTSSQVYFFIFHGLSIKVKFASCST